MALRVPKFKAGDIVINIKPHLQYEIKAVWFNSLPFLRPGYELYCDQYIDLKKEYQWNNELKEIMGD